jgi:hypothetical protein
LQRTLMPNMAWEIELGSKTVFLSYRKTMVFR